MTVAAVLFDMDGVLVDSAALHVQAHAQAFRQAGVEFSEPARAAVRAGKSRLEVIEIAAPGASPRTKRNLSEAKHQAMAVLLQKTKDVCSAGASRTVQALAAAGVPVGVVTNSAAADVLLGAAGLLDIVQVVVANGDVSLPKPSPEGYLLAAQRLGVNPAECIAFEDSHDGWLAATCAGMRVVLVSGERPAWVDEDTEVVASLEASSLAQRILGTAEDDDA